MKEFLAPDGVRWGVEIRSPGASHAMIVFHHPAAGTSRLNRYAWHNWKGPESRNVTARLDEAQVMETLGDRDIARLFRRAMPVSTPY